MNVKIVYMASGQVIIGDLDTDKYEINKPVTLGQDPQTGNIGLVRYGQIPGVLQGLSKVAILREQYLSIEDADKRLEYAWIQATSGIALAASMPPGAQGLIKS